jgi:beta-glucanase (GH16 family)
LACLLAWVNRGGDEAAQATVITDNPSAWSLTFSDDFSGSSLDAAKWANRLPGPRNSAINTANAVTVGGGLLTITTYTDAGVNYTGMIGTQDKFEQTYGYFEARMKFHTSPGQWSAFWLQSQTYGNPVGDPAHAGTEIDIVEHRAVNPSSTDLRGHDYTALHWDGYATDHQQVAKSNGPLPGLGNDTWHTYGLKWSPTGYEYYFDDTLLWTVTQAVSQRSEYMILSSEVRDANWAGNVPAGGYGSSVTNVQVDYVHVYAGMPGDYTGDGAVDAADYVVWRRGFGSAYNQSDYLVWKTYFGAQAGTGSGSSEGSPTQVAIPEPATVLLLILTGAGPCPWRRRAGAR